MYRDKNIPKIKPDLCNHKTISAQLLHETTREKNSGA